jgi:hypothetical protein
VRGDYLSAKSMLEMREGQLGGELQRTAERLERALAELAAAQGELLKEKDKRGARLGAGGPAPGWALRRGWWLS